jgi:hypothetical protein
MGSVIWQRRNEKQIDLPHIICDKSIIIHFHRFSERISLAESKIRVKLAYLKKNWPGLLRRLGDEFKNIDLETF